MRAKLAKEYEDAKDEPNDITTLLNFCDQFSTNVSLRKRSQIHGPPSEPRRMTSILFTTLDGLLLVAYT